ncbi:MAG: hypothetical protein KC561_17245 [Myxococcales bacterium]|nr:hypothetical protein [Myxococcales bacterium]
MTHLSEEIHEIGRRLAELTKPGSSTSRTERAETRALLREAFLATQDDCSVEELISIRERLAEQHRLLSKTPAVDLAERLLKHWAFGVIDEPIFNRFLELKVGASLRNADHLAAQIQARVDSILAMLNDTAVSLGLPEATRPYNAQKEDWELITSRLT